MTTDGAGHDRPLERYAPRTVEHVGVWREGETIFKVYGLLARGKALTQQIMLDAERFVRTELPGAMAREGASNGAGFVIIHPGDLGVSTVAHWWVQGSVLCQRIRRQLYDAEAAMDVADRPVIACVWELAIIDAEQRLWRETMMNDAPSLDAYLSRRTTATTV